jgi:peptidoglycan/LPS O-acetylase OafA/YrhL
MGMFRLLLAMCVVAAHGPSFGFIRLFDAGVAVTCFFVVSGFYMAFVINEKYGKLDQWRLRFLSARAFRLYPTYFVILAFYFMFDLAISTHGYDGPRWLNLLNFTIVGQDILQWWLELQKPQPLSPILIVPAWSVASEILFYLIAAIAFRRSGGILIVFLVALAIHFPLHYARLTGTSDVIKFPPAMLVYFALGAVSYLVYTWVKDLDVRIRAPLAVIPAAVVIFYFGISLQGFQNYYGDPYGLMWGLYLTVACMIPFLFSLTRFSQLDRFIGDLSYPVYLVHGAYFVFAGQLQLGPLATKIYVPAASIGLSALIVLLIERPLDGWRQALSGRRSRLNLLPA